MLAGIGKTSWLLASELPSRATPDNAGVINQHQRP
jgi:hypothetical protein